MKSIIATALLLICTATATLANTGTTIVSTDLIGTDFPLWVQSDTTNLTWGTTAGKTQGRMLRLQDQAPGNRTFYDFGIDGNQNLFITKIGSYTQAFTLSSTGVALSDSLSVGGSVTAGGNLTVSGSVTVNLPTATTTLKHVLIDANGKLYVEP